MKKKKIIFAAVLILTASVLFACTPRKNKAQGQSGQAGSNTASTVNSSADGTEKTSSESSEKDNESKGKSTENNKTTVADGVVEFPDDWFDQDDKPNENTEPSNNAGQSNNDDTSSEDAHTDPIDNENTSQSTTTTDDGWTDGWY